MRDRVLLISADVCVRRKDSFIILESSDVYARVEGSEILDRWIAMLDAGAVASDLHDAPELRRALESLTEAGLVISVPVSAARDAATVGTPGRNGAQDITQSAFMPAFFQACDAWASSIFRSPFWAEFLSGSASQKEVFALVTQLYHRTAGAEVHNLAAVELCQDERILPLLKRHYDEELGHADQLREGLLACGNALLNIEPLPATTALINYMVNAAIEPLRYLGCYGVFHAPSTVRTEGELIEQFRRFSAMYSFAAPAFEALCRHARLDYSLSHDEIGLEKFVRDFGPLSSTEALSALRGARGAARAFRTLFDDIHALGR